MIGAIRLVTIWLMIAVCPAWAQGDWPLWQAFGDGGFLQADGRVLADESGARFSTSEGQAYGLFFALVANDRPAFDRILVWTRDNLAQGDFSARLPAWQWGKGAAGDWGVTDVNSASDADLWLAYSLMEAGRLWGERSYAAYGNLVLANVKLHLMRNLSQTVLLPGETGFEQSGGAVRLNPSYQPVQLLRYFQVKDPSGPWNALIESNLKMLQVVSLKGYVPDWVVYNGQYAADGAAVGSHDAIRVYLWWGMLNRQDTMAPRLKKLLYGMNELIPKLEISPPLTVDTKSGAVAGVSPIGFSAALLPFFSSMGNKEALRLQQERLISQTVPSGLSGGRYYDQVLNMFGAGWLDQRYSFSPKGQLIVKWTAQ